MHSLWNEVAPVAPLLIPLGEALGALVVIGLIAIVTAFVAALVYVLNKTVGRLPLVGGVISVVAHSVEDGVTTTLAGWSASAHRHLGAALHSLARAVDWLGHEVEQHAKLLWTIAGLLIGPGTVAELRALIHRLLRGQAQQHAFNQAQTRDNHSTRAQVKDATREARIAHKAAVAIPGQLSREWDIPRLRDQVKGLEDGASDTFKWIRSHPNSIASGVFAGAVAWALGRVGASWTRCNNWRKLGKGYCAADPSLIESLLADALAIVGTVSLLEFIADAQAVETVALDALGLFIREAPRF